MTRREGTARLIVATGAALTLHALLLSMLAIELADHQAPSPPPRPSSHSPAARPSPRPHVGRPDAAASSVSWIPYDDFRKLMARQARVKQPALQKKARPTRHAPMNLDATPPVPRKPRDRPERPPQAAPSPSPPTPAAAAPPPASQPVRLPDATPVTPTGRTPFANLTAPFHPGKVVTHHRRRVHPTQRTGSPHAAVARPTAAPRSDREASPSSLTDHALDAQPGKVIVGPGIRIKTAAPRFSAVTSASALPENPLAMISFGPGGRVVDVSLVHSSGVEGVDGPVIASLYKWRASGRRIARLHDQRRVRVRVRLLLMDP